MKQIIAPILALGFLAGCSSSGEDELREWMADTRKEMHPAVPKLAEPKRFEPYAYGGQSGADPFNSQKLAMAISKLAAKSSGALKPDQDRRREPLEAYPLDTLQMVGSIERKKVTFALIRADKALHEVKVGQYIGQNFGMITSVSETEIKIKELVQDAVGEWVERMSTLQLQEKR